MRKVVLAALLLLCSGALLGAEENNRANLTIALDPLGDSDQGVVARITFRFKVPEDVPPGIPLLINGSFMSGGAVLRNFRFPIPPDRTTEPLVSVQTLPAGDVSIEARLMVPLEEQTPVILGKTTQKFALAKTNKPFVAGEGAGAEAIVAEGVVPEVSGAMKILPPRRDVAPNLFIVNVEAHDPVKKVEFWVEGKKVMTRNAPPWRAELDLGQLPKRIEVRAVGYDGQGHYVDEDAFVVNERELPLEVKLVRTVTPDNVSHIKLAIQNPNEAPLKSVALYAGKTKIHEWSAPPYAINIAGDRLKGVDFLRASVTDNTNYEASDLLFLNGDRYTEEIEVNLVELPVSVTDASGAPIANLKREDFQIFENGKSQKTTSFNFASNLPISAGVLVDHSGSMKPRMKATKDAAVEFFHDIMHGGDRAFIAGFAFDPAKSAPFVTDVGSLQAQAEAIPDASGGTSLYDAIVTGLYRFRNLQGRKALIVLTDGEDTTSRLTYDQMMEYVRASRVPIYFIGIALGFGDMAGAHMMRAVADETGGVAYFIKNVNQLKETYVELENELRSQYLLAYNTESSKKDTAYRTVEVKVDKAGAKVRTIRGFIP